MTVDGIQPAAPFGTQTRDRKHGDVVVHQGPEWLEVGDHIQLSEAANVFGIDQLEVTDVMPAVSYAIDIACARN